MKENERKERLINSNVVLAGHDIIAEPVYNQQGCLLLNRGASITRKNRTQLRGHGINQVYVTSREGKVPAWC